MRQSRLGALRQVRNQKKSHPALFTRGGGKKSRQRPTFALRLSSALAGLTAVFGMGTGVTLPVWSPGKKIVERAWCGPARYERSHMPLWQRENRGTNSMMIKPMDRLVSVSSVPLDIRTYTSDLSTWWSTTDLIGRIHLGVGFTLRCFQRLSCP